MKFDFTALTVIAVSVAGSWTGLSVKYDRKLSVLSQKIDTCSKGDSASTSTDSDILSQVAEAIELSTQSLETSKRVERRLEEDDDSPFTKSKDRVGEWWFAKPEAMFLIPGGIVIGNKNDNCNYGKGVLSVDRGKRGCPSEDGSVTFTKQTNDDPPFTKDGDWWVASPGSMFLIPEGLVIGKRNADCIYGEGVLSVNGGSYRGDNCPSGDGSATFGSNNKATGDGSVTFGNYNMAEGPYSVVSGGQQNIARGRYSTVSGGQENLAKGDYSTVSGGQKNDATGDYSTVSGGVHNTASGIVASVSGGVHNTASGEIASILGGFKKNLSKDFGIFPQ